MGTDLYPWGWDAARAAGYAAMRRCDLRPARVSEVTDGVCTLLTATGVARASAGGGLLGRAAADLSALPCVGDWVLVRAWPDDRATVEAVLHRHTHLAWPAPGRSPDGMAQGRRSRAMARVANVDAVAVLEPWRPRPDLDRIARLRDFAAAAGVRFLVLITSAGASGAAGAGVPRRGVGWAGTGGAAVRGTGALAAATGWSVPDPAPPPGVLPARPPGVLPARPPGVLPAWSGELPVRLAELRGRAGAAPAPPDPVAGRPAPLPRGPDEVVSLIEAVLPGVPVLLSSGPGGSATGEPGTVDPLRAFAGPGRTLALFGAPGTTTSPVIAALAGTSVLRPSRPGGDGIALIALPGGGVVIDVPDVPAW